MLAFTLYFSLYVKYTIFCTAIKHFYLSPAGPGHTLDRAENVGNQQAPVFRWHFVQKVNCIINCAHSIYRTTNKSSACTTQFNNSKLPASYIHFHTIGIQYPARIDLRAKSAIPSRPPCVPCLCHRCEERGGGGRGSKFTFECLYSREIHLPSTQWAPGSEIKSAAIVQ